MAIAKSTIVDGLKGRVGNVVFVQNQGSTIVRAAPMTLGSAMPSPAQAQVRERTTRASRAWRALSVEAVRAWNDYGATLGLSGNNAFVRLYTKLLRMDSAAPAPGSPPAAPFLGDAPRITVSSVPGAIRFTASGANATVCRTELLVQALPSQHCRAYAERYRSRAIVRFTSGALTADVPVPPGVYATAVRFVLATTGQETPMGELGRVTVPLATLGDEPGG